MSQTILIKRSAVPGKVPLTADLQLGEIAINTYDGKIFIKQDNGTQTIREIGDTSGFVTLTGAQTISGAKTFSTAIVGSLTGNASTATTLQTARTLTIGSTGKSFNGSGNVTWSLAEIGAQAAGNYVTTDTTQTITAAKTMSGVLTMSGVQFRAHGGTAALPGITFGADTDTGFTNPAANVLALSTTGAERLRVTSAGNLLIATTTDNGDKLQVSGDSTLSRVKVGDGSVTAPSIAFSADTNTGFYRVGAETIGVTTSGSLSMTFANGSVTSAVPFMLQNGSTTAPSLTFAADTNTGMYLSAANQLSITTGGSEAFRALAGGDVYVFGRTMGVSGGTAAAPAFTWTSDTDTGMYRVSSNVIGFSTGGTVAATMNAAGDFVATGNVTAYSDRRLKTNLNVIDSAVAKVEKLTGYTYTRTDTGSKQTGIIAQDLMQVLPEAVDATNEHLAVAYGNMAGLFVEAIKELTSRIKVLEDELSSLRGQ